MNKDIVADLEVLLKFISTHSDSEEVNVAYSRVASYLATYKLDDEHGDL